MKILIRSVEYSRSGGGVRRCASSRAEGEESSRISSQVLEDYAPTQKGQGSRKAPVKGFPPHSSIWRQCSIAVSDLPSLENLHVFHAEVLTLHVSETGTQAQDAPRGKKLLRQGDKH
jgi:hypothetical protein